MVLALSIICSPFQMKSISIEQIELQFSVMNKITSKMSQL